MGEAMKRGRFTLGRQSSLAPEKENDSSDLGQDESDSLKSAKDLEAVSELLYSACKGDVDGVESLLAKGVNVDAADLDGRTALHLAACEGQMQVIEHLVNKGANLNLADRWGSTPLGDAVHYDRVEVSKFLEARGARLPKSSMRVRTQKEVPEYEINPSELVFKDSEYKLPNHRVATWHGTKVAVKALSTIDISDEETLLWFTEELALLQKLRHPNVVQFLGAVTQSAPMMIVTEFLPQMDLGKYLHEKGCLEPERVIAYALDIARGMNYLHEHKPEAIIHRDLKPSNLLRDGKHLKVANFGLSIPTYDSDPVHNDSPHLKPKGTSCRYMAPELYRNHPHDKSVDVFSFALIVQEMMEGSPPFHFQPPEAVARVYAIDNRRPPFRHHARRYPGGLKELIEECWDSDTAKRPNFSQIISRLMTIQDEFGSKRCCWVTMRCLSWAPLEMASFVIHRKKLMPDSTTASSV